MVCTFIVYQRLEHSSWFGTTRVVKQTVVVTFHGVYIGMRYLWNFIIHCIFSIWELTKYLWLVWQRQRKLQHNSQHAILENTSRNETEQVKDEDSIVFPTSLISFTLPIENVSHAMESNVVAKDTAVPEEVYWIKNEKEEDDETIRVLPNEEEVEEIQPIKDSVDIPNDWQEEEEVYASDLNEVLYNGTSKVSECIKEESTMDNQSNEMDAYVPKEEMINEEDFFTQASRNDWDHMEESVVEDNVSQQQDNRIVDTLEM